LGNLKAEATVAQDRFLNAQEVWNKYKQLGDFEAKYISNSPVADIYKKSEQAAIDAVHMADKPPIPGAFREDNVWKVWVQGPNGAVKHRVEAVGP
jgi:hypothetical protein